MTSRIDLSREAVLVKATFSSWSGDKRLDENVAVDFNTQVEVEKDAMKHTKRLLSKSKLAANCRNSISQARKFHRENTVPWTYDGWGLLSKRNYEIYQLRMDQYNREVYDAASLLFENFSQEVRDDRRVLGRLFDPAAYIMPHEVFEKFKIDIQYEPIVDTHTIHFDAMSEQVQRMIDQTRQRQEDALRNASDDLRRRVESILNDTIQRLETITESSHKPSALLKSIEDMADLLPRLNIQGDPDIELAAQAMKERLLTFSAEELKHDRQSRDSVMNAAREIGGIVGRKIRMPIPKQEEVDA
jgi:hypothetical protein